MLFNLWQVTLFLHKLMYSLNQWSPDQRLELREANKTEKFTVKYKLCGTVEISCSNDIFFFFCILLYSYLKSWLQYHPEMKVQGVLSLENKIQYFFNYCNYDLIAWHPRFSCLAAGYQDLYYLFYKWVSQVPFMCIFPVLVPRLCINFFLSSFKLNVYLRHFI